MSERLVRVSGKKWVGRACLLCCRREVKRGHRYYLGRGAVQHRWSAGVIYLRYEDRLVSIESDGWEC